MTDVPSVTPTDLNFTLTPETGNWWHYKAEIDQYNEISGSIQGETIETAQAALSEIYPGCTFNEQ